MVLSGVNEVVCIAVLNLVWLCGRVMRQTRLTGGGARRKGGHEKSNRELRLAVPWERFDGGGGGGSGGDIVSDEI